MREHPITCADGAALQRVDKQDQDMRRRVEKAETADELREICTKLRARLRLVERHAVQTAGRIAVMKGEIRTLAKSRERLQVAVRVLAAQVNHGTPEERAADIAAMYDPKRVPF